MKLRELMILCLVLVLATVPVTVTAASDNTISFGDLIAALTSGPCGEDMAWELDKDGTLTISGTGPMKAYASSAAVPWYSKKALIKTVVIDGGVTAISDYAFSDCTNLTDVYFDGTQAQWDAIDIGSNNGSLLDATLHVADTQPGDVDADGKLNTDDAVYLLLHVMFGTEDYPVPAGTNLDFNGDSKVNTDDAVYLLLHVMFGATDYPLSLPVVM